MQYAEELEALQQQQLLAALVAQQQEQAENQYQQSLQQDGEQVGVNEVIQALQAAQSKSQEQSGMIDLKDLDKELLVMLIQNNVLDPEQTAKATAILAEAEENPEEQSEQ